MSSDARRARAQGKAALASEIERIPAGSHWRHYKGHTYVVVTHALREHDGAVCVVYRGKEGIQWTRPAREWEQATKGGTPRFVRVS